MVLPASSKRPYAPDGAGAAGEDRTDRMTLRKTGVGVATVVAWVLMATPGLGSVRDVFVQAAPSVVRVAALDAEGRATSFGTGFYIDDHGTVVTNFHVIDGAAAVRVTDSSSQTYEVRGVSGHDKLQDLALLTVAVDRSPPLGIATTRAQVGDEVIAIGNPLGLENTISTGIISGVRSMTENVVLYQITAAISPGSSGGPVLNPAGELVGITKATIESGQSLNFAIPTQTLELLLVRSSGHVAAAVRSVTGYESPHVDPAPRQDALGLTDSQRREYTKLALRVKAGQTSHMWTAYRGEFPMSELGFYQVIGDKSKAETVQRQKETNAATGFLAVGIALAGAAYGLRGSLRTKEEVRSYSYWGGVFENSTVEKPDPDYTAMGVGLGAVLLGGLIGSGVKTGNVYPAHTAAQMADRYNRELILEMRSEW